MIRLINPLFEIHTGQEKAYGGAQRWFPKKRLQNSGCGIIACANILTQAGYIGKHSKYAVCPKDTAEGSADRRETLRQVDRDSYMRLARTLSFYLPVIEGFGLNGIVMAMGINIYFLFHRLPFVAFWGFSKRRRDKRIEKMLSQDIPVCLAIGPNFPNLFGKHCITLYKKQGGDYLPDTTINAHYVSVTGMDDEWYEISSWGQHMYINKREYDTYAKKHSGYVLSNILYVKPLRRS